MLYGPTTAKYTLMNKYWTTNNCTNNIRFGRFLTLAEPKLYQAIPNHRFRLKSSCTWQRIGILGCIGCLACLRVEVSQHLAHYSEKMGKHYLENHGKKTANISSSTQPTKLVANIRKKPIQMMIITISMIIWRRAFQLDHNLIPWCQIQHWTNWIYLEK